MAWRNRVLKRVGRRGICLSLLSLIFVGVGFSTMVAKPIQYDGLPILRLISPDIWGIVQIVMGLVALGFAFRPSGKDLLGFQLTFLIPLFWGMDNFLGSFTGAFPGGGIAQGIRAGIIWFGFAGLVLLLSGMIGVEEVQNNTNHERDGNEPRK